MAITFKNQAQAEKRMKATTPSADILAFFDTRDPVTGIGKIRLARALLKSGDKDAGLIHLHDAWVNHNFSLSQERQILKDFGHLLSPEDHAARVDRLLFARQVTISRRIFSRLKSSDRRMAEARAALLLGAASGPTLYDRLPREEQLDSGVLHAAVRHHRRAGNSKRAIALASLSPKDPETLRNSSRWWFERRLLMREALKKGRFADAYSVTSNHGLDPHGDFAVAEFNAGWIALRFLNDPARAETHFLALASVVKMPISVARAFYWLGRAAEERGNNAVAAGHYAHAAGYIYTYYGQLAAEKIGGTALEVTFDKTVPSSVEDRALFTSRPVARAMRMLADLDHRHYMEIFGYHLDGHLERPGEYVEFSKLARSQGATHLAVRAGKVAVRRGAFTPDVSYPELFVPQEVRAFVPPELTLGISRVKRVSLTPVPALMRWRARS